MKEVYAEQEVKEKKVPKHNKARIEYYDGSYIHVANSEVERIIKILSYLNKKINGKKKFVSAKEMACDLKINHPILVRTLRGLFGAKSISILSDDGRRKSLKNLIKVEQAMHNPKANLPNMPNSYSAPLKIRLGSLGSG